MTNVNESRHSSNGSLLWSLLALLICVAIVGFFWLRFQIRHSLQRADCVELRETLKRWTEAGRPQGERLIDFMRGRRPDLVVSNRLFAIGETNYATQFALTRPK